LNVPGISRLALPVVQATFKIRLDKVRKSLGQQFHRFDNQLLSVYIIFIVGNLAGTGRRLNKN
jgi:hypothetical protein